MKGLNLFLVLVAVSSASACKYFCRTPGTSKYECCDDGNPYFNPEEASPEAPVADDTVVADVAAEESDDAVQPPANCYYYCAYDGEVYCCGDTSQPSEYDSTDSKEIPSLESDDSPVSNDSSRPIRNYLRLPLSLLRRPQLDPPDGSPSNTSDKITKGDAETSEEDNSIFSPLSSLFSFMDFSSLDFPDVDLPTLDIPSLFSESQTSNETDSENIESQSNVVSPILKSDKSESVAQNLVQVLGKDNIHTRNNGQQAAQKRSSMWLPATNESPALSDNLLVKPSPFHSLPQGTVISIYNPTRVISHLAGSSPTLPRVPTAHFPVHNTEQLTSHLNTHPFLQSAMPHASSSSQTTFSSPSFPGQIQYHGIGSLSVAQNTNPLSFSMPPPSYDMIPPPSKLKATPQIPITVLKEDLEGNKIDDLLNSMLCKCEADKNGNIDENCDCKYGEDLILIFPPEPMKPYMFVPLDSTPKKSSKVIPPIFREQFLPKGKLSLNEDPPLDIGGSFELSDSEVIFETARPTSFNDITQVFMPSSGLENGFSHAAPSGLIGHTSSLYDLPTVPHQFQVNQPSVESLYELPNTPHQLPVHQPVLEPLSEQLLLSDASHDIGDNIPSVISQNTYHISPQQYPSSVYAEPLPAHTYPEYPVYEPYRPVRKTKKSGFPSKYDFVKPFIQFFKAVKEMTEYKDEDKKDKKHHIPVYQEIGPAYHIYPGSGYGASLPIHENYQYQTHPLYNAQSLYGPPTTIEHSYGHPEIIYHAKASPSIASKLPQATFDQGFSLASPGQFPPQAQQASLPPQVQQAPLPPQAQQASLPIFQQPIQTFPSLQISPIILSQELHSQETSDENDYDDDIDDFSLETSFVAISSQENISDEDKDDDSTLRFFPNPIANIIVQDSTLLNSESIETLSNDNESQNSESNTAFDSIPSQNTQSTQAESVGTNSNNPQIIQATQVNLGSSILHTTPSIIQSQPVKSVPTNVNSPVIINAIPVEPVNTRIGIPLPKPNLPVVSANFVQPASISHFSNAGSTSQHALNSFATAPVSNPAQSQPGVPLFLRNHLQQSVPIKPEFDSSVQSIPQTQFIDSFSSPNNVGTFSNSVPSSSNFNPTLSSSSSSGVPLSNNPSSISHNFHNFQPRVTLANLLASTSRKSLQNSLVSPHSTHITFSSRQSTAPVSVESPSDSSDS